jgi:nucleotide-binding universal stress UspA family protein
LKVRPFSPDDANRPRRAGWHFLFDKPAAASDIARGGKNMIPEIKHILYATDMSENARFAFGYAAGMANRYDAKITILHVLEEPSPTTMLLIGDIVGEKRFSSLRSEKENEVIASIQKRLEDFTTEFCRQTPQCPFTVDRIIVETGHPVGRIIAAVEKIGADIIVMGSYGHGMLEQVVIGSTSRRVLRRCKKPVLVVRLPENGSSDQ